MERSATCGSADTSLSFGVEDVEQCCATSRHIIIDATSPQAAPLWACQRLSMVKHLRRLLYFTFLRRLRNLRERRHTRCCVVRAYCHTPLQTRRSIIYNHLIFNDINRASGYNLHNPTLAPKATMWGQPNTPHHQQPRRGCRPSC